MQPSTVIARDSSISVRRRWPKYLLWALMGCSTIVIWVYIEIPLLMLPREEVFLRSVPWLILLHALGGTIALISGPLQFSDRLRRRYPKFHRVSGRVYIGSVLVAAPIAIVIAASHSNFKVIYFTITTAIQSGVWLTTTGVALVAARNRHIQRHRVWMARSYAVTFTFVSLRLLRFIPAWNHMNGRENYTALIVVTLLSAMVPEIAFFGRSLGASVFRRFAD